MQSGNAAISQSGGGTTINQISDKAIINWQSYGIAPNELVRYLQPSQSSVALNRVVGGDPSVILGQLQANGRVFLLNPNGILFGQGAQVNVGGLLAATLSMNNSDFLNGYYRLTQDPSKPPAAVINQGNIQVTNGGSAALIAPLAYNSGLITADRGQIAIGGTQKAVISFDSNRLINFISTDPAASSGAVLIPASAVNDILANVINRNIAPASALTENPDGSYSLSGASGLGANAGALQAGQAEISGSSVSLSGGSLNVNSLILDPASLTITDNGTSGTLAGELTASGSSTSLAANAADQGANTLDWTDVQNATTITLATTGAITINISTAYLPNAAVKFTGSGISVAAGSSMTFKTFDVSGVTGAITNVNSTTINGSIIRPSSSSTTSSTSSSSSSSSSTASASTSTSTSTSTSSSSGSTSTASASTSSTAPSNAATASIVSNSISTSSQNSAETSQALTTNMSNFAGSSGNTKGSYVTIGSNVVSGPGAVTPAINNSVSSVSEGAAVVWGTPPAANNSPSIAASASSSSAQLVSSSIKPDGTTEKTYRLKSGEVDTIQKNPNGTSAQTQWFPDGDHSTTTWSANGDKVTTSWAKNGDTDRTAWHKNGDTIKEQWFPNGNHSTTTWSANGDKVTTSWAKNGDTDRTAWHKNGDTIKEQWFKNGNSVRSESHSDGSSAVTYNYSNGVKVTQDNNKYGATTATTTHYPNGEAVTAQAPIHITGNLTATTQTHSYPNGTTEKTTQYSDGRVSGTTSYANGQTESYQTWPGGYRMDVHHYPNGYSTKTMRQSNGYGHEDEWRGNEIIRSWTLLPNGSKIPSIPGAH